MAEHSNWAGRALENLAGLADGKPKYMRLVTGDPAECRCDRLPGHECHGRITAEDLLCDTCRTGNCCAMNLGSGWLDNHQAMPEWAGSVTWGPSGVRDWGRAQSVTWTGPLDSVNARTALGEDADGE